MTKFLLSTVRVGALTVLVILAGGVNPNQTLTRRMSDDAALSNILQKFDNPYIQSSHVKQQNTNASSISDLTVERTIDETINEFKPLLDENNRGDNPADATDTSIIEFSTSPETYQSISDNSTNLEPLKHNIARYKKLRQRIGKVLKSEQVSDKVKALVTKTLDQMISQLLNNQCTWRNRADETDAFPGPGDIIQNDKKTMIRSWTNKWKELIEKFSMETNYRDTDGSSYKDMYLFLMRLQEFFFEIHDELSRLNTRYELKCQLVDKDKFQLPKKFSVVSDRNSLRQHTKSYGNDDLCKNIKICPEELKNFLADFYINLKETVDVVFRDYVEMYKRDVNTNDSKEKRSFVALLKDITSLVDEKISKAFKKESNKLKLNAHNSTQARLTAINKFVEITADFVHKMIGKFLTTQLKTLEATLRVTVKRDLYTTLGIELGNLKKDFNDKACTVFQTCNGYAIRRQSNGLQNSLHLDKNNIFVKLKPRLDGTDLFRRSGSKPRVRQDEKKQDRGYNRYRTSSFDLKKYMNVSITRTSYFDLVKRSRTKSATKRTTKSTTKRTTKRTTQSTPNHTSTTKSIMKTTTSLTSTTYTYKDYIRRMRALGKINNSPPPHWTAQTKESATEKPSLMKRVFGSFIN